MMRKSGNRFSEQIMLKQESMMRKSGNRFSPATNAGRACAEIMLKPETER
jgi:hypothetical protein